MAKNIRLIKLLMIWNLVNNYKKNLLCEIMEKQCYLCKKELVWPDTNSCYYCQKNYCGEHRLSENHRAFTNLWRKILQNHIRW